MRRGLVSYQWFWSGLHFLIFPNLGHAALESEMNGQAVKG